LKSYTSTPVELKWKKNKSLVSKDSESFFDWFGYKGENDTFEDGIQVALLLAEDIYPNAIKLFTSSMESEGEEDEDLDIEEDEEQDSNEAKRRRLDEDDEDE